MLPIGTSVLFKGEVGVVRFVGEAQFAPGVWIGVELQEPNGKNDGSVNGEKYFDCADKHGIFVRDSMLEVVDGSTSSSRPASRAPSRIQSRSSDIYPSDDSNDETKRLKTIIQRLQDKLLMMKSDIEKLRNDLQLSEANNSTLYDKLAKAEEDLEISAIDKETLEEKNELLNQEIKSLSEQNAKVLEELNTLKNELQQNGKSIDSSLMNESTESLIKRNSLLEDALLRLREYTSNEKSTYTEKIAELESQIKPLSDIESQYKVVSQKLTNAERIIEELRSHIDTSIHSSEIIESLTDKNNCLIEENSKLKLSLKELEDLRQVGEELEAFHTETESQLQKEIAKLKESFDSQQAGVTNLEKRNIELQSKLQELQVLNHKLSQLQQEDNTANGETHNSENVQIDVNFKEGLNLKLKIIEAEAKFKEKELDYYEVIFGKSEAIILKQTSLQLHKFSQISKILGCHNLNTTSDLFISVLNSKVQYSLKSFSSFLKFVATRYEYAKTHNELKTTNLSSVTDKLIECIVEQDYRDVPDLEVIKSEMMECIDKMNSAFTNKSQLIYDLEQEICSSEAIVRIITTLKVFEAETKLSLSLSDINELYHLANERKLIMTQMLEKIENDESSEISKTNVLFLSPQISSFIEKVLLTLTCLGEESNLKSDTVVLVEAFKNHEGDKIEWNIIDTPQNWFLKDISAEKINLKETHELHEEVERSRAELQNKENQIEEINLKVNVLNSRIAISKETENKLKKYREDVSLLTQENEDLNTRVQDLLASNNQLSLDLQKARSNALLHNSQFESLYEQKQFNEKSDLVSEIHSLRNVVRTLTKRHRNDRSWLRVEIPKRRPFEKTDADELRLIGRDLRKAVANVKINPVKRVS